MKGELRRTLERQAAWQRARSAESWAAKLRTAVIMRQAALVLRTSPAAPQETPETVREMGD